jgi:hypothetical protein
MISSGRGATVAVKAVNMTAKFVAGDRPRIEDT